MESISKITYSIVSLVVIVLIVATTVIPVIESSQGEIVTHYQNTTQTYAAVVSDDVTLTRDAAGKITLNGYEITYTETLSRCAIISDGLFYVMGQYECILDLSNSSRVATTGTATVSLTMSGGAFTYTVGSAEPVTGTYTKAYIISAKGDYGLFDGDSTDFKATAGKTIDVVFPGATGLTTLIGWYTVKDGVVQDTPVVSFKTNSSGTLVNFDGTYTINTGINTSGSSEYVSEYNKATCRFTPTSGTVSTTSGSYIAPLEYTDVTDNDSAIRALLGVIPIMLIVVPIVIASRLITQGRD